MSDISGDLTDQFKTSHLHCKLIEATDVVRNAHLIAHVWYGMEN
jgi:hypothetical protein